MVLASQTVAVVPLLVPVTATVINLPFIAVVKVRVVVVALEIRVQVEGMVCVVAVIALVHEYHW